MKSPLNKDVEPATQPDHSIMQTSDVPSGDSKAPPSKGSATKQDVCGLANDREGRDADLSDFPIVTAQSVDAAMDPPAGAAPAAAAASGRLSRSKTFRNSWADLRERVKKDLFNFAKFIGPGFMIAVAYSMYLPTNLILKTIPRKRDRGSGGNPQER